MMIGDAGPLYGDGEVYDRMIKSREPEDLPFYLQMARDFGDPVLELACGTGRVALPLAQAGLEVSGLDLSAPMLELARQKAREQNLAVQFVTADLRAFRFDGKFNLILLPFNAFHHLLTREDVEQCLNSVRLHLTADGRFILDAFNPILEYLVREPAERRFLLDYEDPREGRVVLEESNVYDRATQINHLTWYARPEGGGERAYHWDMRVFYPQELDTLLLYHGFEITAKYGNYDRTSFSSNSPNQIVVARKR